MTLQIRRDTSSNWTTANPTLADGQFGFETNTGRIKVGDGTTAWTSLAYRFESASGVSDGDKGDITVSGTGATWTIDNNTVTLSKMADLATSTILGRVTGGTGDPEALSPTQVKTLLAIAASDVSGLATVATSGSASDLGSGTLPVGRLSFTKAQLDTAVSDGNVQYVGDAPTAHTHLLAAGATDVTITAANLNALDDGADTTLHFHASDRNRANHTGTQLAATISDFATAVAATAAVTANTAKVTNATHTGDVTGSGALTIANDVVTNAKLANMATATIKGRTTAGTGDPEDLTATQATALLDTFTSGAKGLAPASGGGTTNFLRADGTWAAPPGGGGGGTGDVVGPASATDEAIARFDTTTGKLIQDSTVRITDNGSIILPENSFPTPASAGEMKLFARALASRIMPAFVGPSGLDSTVQPNLGGNRILQVTPTSGTTAPGAWGGNVGVAGTASFQQSFTSTNRWLSTARKRYQTTTTAGNAASTRTAYLSWFRGSAAGFGGFFFRIQFGININLNGSQCFVGLCPATGALGGNPSTDFPLNMCGMGFDSTDLSTGNWQFFRNDGVGSPVKVDLGATEAARTADVGYELIMFMAPGGSELFVQITNLNTGNDVLTTSYTTDIPAVNTGMALKCDIRNGAVAAACNIEWAKIYIEADY